MTHFSHLPQGQEILPALAAGNQVGWPRPWGVGSFTINHTLFKKKKLNQDLLDFFLGLGQVGSDVNQRAHWLLLTTFSFSYNYAQLSHKPVILLKTFFYDKSPFFNIWGRRQLRLLQGKYWFSTSRTYLETKIDKKSSHVFSLGPKRLPGIFFNPPIYSIT